MIKEVFVLSFLLSFQYVLNVSANHYLNEWAAEIKGGIEHAKRVARSHGYELVSEVCIHYFILKKIAEIFNLNFFLFSIYF